MKKIWSFILIFILGVSVMITGTACSSSSSSSAHYGNEFDNNEDTTDEEKDNDDVTDDSSENTDDNSNSTESGEGKTTEDADENNSSEETQDETGDESKPVIPEDETTEESKEGQTEDEDTPVIKPIPKPTIKPTEAPTQKPIEAPTQKPTEAPTQKPTETPTQKPTEAATAKPTETPTTKPTQAPATTADTTPWQSGGNDYDYSELRSYSDISSDDIARARSVLSSIISNGMSDLDKIKAVNDFLVKNTTYDVDYYSRSDSHNHLTNILVNKVGVCQGYSVAFYVFMKELGIPCSLMSGNADNGSGSVPHAWNAVKINGEWYFVDVTWNDPFVNDTTAYPNGENISYEYLLCTFDHIGLTHTYDSYVGEQPTPYGASNEYNNYMYMSMGYDGFWRVNSEAEVIVAAQSINSFGTYMFVIQNGCTTANALYNLLKLRT